MSLRVAVICLALLLGVDSASTQPAVTFAPVGDETASFQTETLLSDLDNPAGLALRPTLAKRGPYEFFVAESGSGRVLRVLTDAPEGLDDSARPGESAQPDEPAQQDVVVTGFPMGRFGQQPEYRVGPLGLGFITRSRLIVSAKGAGPLADLLLGYSLPSAASLRGGIRPSATSVEQGAGAASAPHHSVGPLADEIASQVDDLQLSALAMADKACYVITGGQASQGWVLKASIEANRLVDLRPFIDLQKTVGCGGPSAIALVPQPRPAFLVVGLTGKRDAAQDSRLAFFVPSTGKLALDLPTGLHDIVSLAYSPSGQLYAADFSWHDKDAGGVYRIDDARDVTSNGGQQTCRAVKIASLVRPFCLAFAPDGSMFVTSLGAGGNIKQGTLVKISGEL